jgi:hypothetical protein
MFKPKKKVVEEVEEEYEQPIEEVEEEEELEEEEEDDDKDVKFKPPKSAPAKVEPQEQVKLTTGEVVAAIEFNLNQANNLLQLLK